MTDKAAREAFEKRGMGLEMYLATDKHGTYVDSYANTAWSDFLAGYQAAHDAAMAAEPDVRAVRMHLLINADPECELDALSLQVVDALALRLQAAQQREAECRKDAERYRWLRQPYDRSVMGVEQAWAQITNRSIDGSRFDAVVDEGIAFSAHALATQPASNGETT